MGVLDYFKEKVSKKHNKKNNIQDEITEYSRTVDDIYGRMKQLDNAPGAIRTSQIVYEEAMKISKELGLENGIQEQTESISDVEQLENFKNKIIDTISKTDTQLFLDPDIKKIFLYPYLQIKKCIIELTENENIKFQDMESHIDDKVYKNLILYYHSLGLFDEKEFESIQTMKKTKDFQYNKIMLKIGEIIEKKNQFVQRYNDVIEFRKILEDGNIEISGYESEYNSLTKVEKGIIFYAYLSDKVKFDFSYSSDLEEKHRIEKMYLGEPGKTRTEATEYQRKSYVLYNESLIVCNKLGIINDSSRGMHR